MIVKYRKYQIVLVAILSLFSTNCLADCVLNGVLYPEGAVVGGRVCIQGQWR